MTELRISDDGSTVAFVRGSAPNGDGWVANPASDPNGARARDLGRAHRDAGHRRGGSPRATRPEVSPDGRFVLYVKDGQIYRARVSQTPAATTPIDKGEKPFIDAWGRNSGPKWSPDGTKIAFSSNRNDHSFIGMYDVKTRTVSYIAPSVDRDTSPTWSPDGKHIAFLRRPGLPFGAAGRRPGAAAACRAADGGRGGGGGGRRRDGRRRTQGGRGAAPAAPRRQRHAPARRSGSRSDGRRTGGRTRRPVDAATAADAAGGGGRRRCPGRAARQASPGLYRAALPNGSTLALMVADVATGEAKEVWHPAAGRSALQQHQPSRGRRHVVFSITNPQDNDDESPRYYSLKISRRPTRSPCCSRRPTASSRTQTAWTLSKDGKTLYYCTNTNDIDRRHIWAVPTCRRHAAADHDRRRHRERAGRRSRQASRSPC